MSVTDGQHKVPISIQRPAPRRLLAHGDARRSRGAAGRAPPAPGPAAAALPAESGPPQPAAPRELPPGAATGRCRRALPGPQTVPGGAAEADTRITLLQAPESGGGAGGGAGSCESAQNFFSSPLSLRSQSYKLIWSKKKKIIKKTYKITIEKVILLGEAPLRLHGAFVLF